MAINPVRKAIPITKSDTTDLTANNIQGLYVGGTGHVTVLLAGDPAGTPVLFSAVPVGTILPIRVTKVMSTGTTATLITALCGG